MEKFLDMLTESCLSIVEQCGRCGVNGLIAIEDLGLQDRLIVPPDLWRQLFKPRYDRIFSKAHELGMHTFMHSCGFILQIIPDLIEAGLDVLQIDQQDNMGIDELSKAGQGNICFFCPADIQTILVKPDNFEQIKKRVSELITRLGTEKGGFIAKTYPQGNALEIAENNVKFMCDMFKMYGNYKH